jgi:hypothetical protein
LLKDYAYYGENSQKTRFVSILYTDSRLFGHNLDFFVAKTLHQYPAVIVFKINT